MNIQKPEIAIFIMLLVGITVSPVYSQTPQDETALTSPALKEISPQQKPIFDDKRLLDGWANSYAERSKEILLAMIQDDTITPYQMAAAVHVFKEKYSQEVFSREKRIIEKILLRRLNKTNSAFVQVEIMHTLCRMDRYKYYDSMMPALIQKLNHYNSTINESAYAALNDIIDTGNNRAREARILFKNLRRVFFLTRRRLAKVTEPDDRLKQKLKLVRWAVKVLGTQELKRLPKEVIPLL
ncbi:MAG: hypothetical protein KAJ18_04025 [Candidatus Omnitrophica bacterium]|nr:hypothetical protein [Candidatus Omnitrophota bacterium]